MMPDIAILGATGLVGRKFIEVLEARDFPLRSLRLFASQKSAGSFLPFKDRQIPVEDIAECRHAGFDIALSSLPASVSRQYLPALAAEGTFVIDNSSAFRMDPDVPLVIAEVNPEAMANNKKNIVANPNCSTIQMLVALYPLHKKARLRRIVVSTYQSSSGKGMRALRQLDAEWHGVQNVEQVHKGQLAFNVLPQDWPLGDDGYSQEEWKMIVESRKILDHPTLEIYPTTARVPVKVGHAEAVWAEFWDPISVEEANNILESSPGVTLAGDNDEMLMPLFCEGKDTVFVGRLRQSRVNPHAIQLWVVADNLRKGAATNAIQIAELCIEHAKSHGMGFRVSNPGDC